MAMDPMDREPNVYNRETNVNTTEGRGSNTLAYLIGGLVIALGLLAFLFYGTDRDEVSTTGSTATQTETAPSASPSSPSTGSTTAPATPTSPSSPAPAAPSTAPQQ